ncbi:FAD/NAD(P)-binding domain-containing protein [Mycena maculata]|uniref:FAD/NAD(P)-binding domain-containing protein n=1 Tax=Mycena maculata TaxID=230809 RepID=A0AAD7K588_9AGAR|nr:FAD/NAD(P)-binding domain-containing protein [Mycena maculata]
MATPNDSSRPLNISIVGAGIGGLTAAIALRRNGHLVEIFEAAETKAEIGAGLGVQINALRVLEHLGLSKDNLKSTPSDGNVVFDGRSGEGRTMSWLIGPTNGLLCHRNDLYEELNRLATGEGEGPPAKLRLGSKVVRCNAEEGSISLESGEVVHADFVLGADGVNSIIRTNILGYVQNAPSCGFSCFRMVLEASNAQENPELAWFYEGASGTRVILVNGEPFRRLIIYLVQNRTLINVVAFYADSPEDEAGSVPTVTREEVLDKFHGRLDPKFLRLFDLPVRGSIRKWKIRALPMLPTWVLGRAALLGDAAHATAPLLAQGAGMAIEEGGALGCLLPAGTRREDIPARLQAYQDLRKERGDFVRKESVDQASKPAIFVRSLEIQRILLEYDTLKTSQEFYQERFGKAD